jgi:zinc transport system ATP-binding protein
LNSHSHNHSCDHNHSAESSSLNSKILISAKDISVHIQDKCILDKVSLEVHESEILTLIGPNGAGKSTLIKCLLGIVPVNTGSIFKMPSLRLGYVPQKTHFNPSLPIQVEGFLALAGDFTQTEILNALLQVKAEKLAKSPLQNISGGEFQRVLLARAILRKPHLLVLDEPSQGMDINGQQELYALLSNIKKDLNSAILMVSHDLHLVMSSTDRVVCLNQHICCSGLPESVSSDPAYLQLFGLKEGKGFAIYEHHHNHHHDVSGNIVQDD